MAFLDKNGIEHFEVAYGAALGNAVCVDVNWRLAPPEVDYIVQDGGAKVFVVGPDFVPVLDAIADGLTHVLNLVIAGHAEATRTTHSWVGEHDAGDPGSAEPADDVAMQLYSSGTTGRPKGVMLTNDNFFALLPTGVDMWDFDARRRQPRRDAAVPHRRRRLGDGGHVRRRQERHRPRARPGRLVRLIPAQG